MLLEPAFASCMPNLRRKKATVELETAGGCRWCWIDTRPRCWNCDLHWHSKNIQTKEDGGRGYRYGKGMKGGSVPWKDPLKPGMCHTANPCKLDWHREGPDLRGGVGGLLFWKSGAGNLISVLFRNFLFLGMKTISMLKFRVEDVEGL